MRKLIYNSLLLLLLPNFLWSQPGQPDMSFNGMPYEMGPGAGTGGVLTMAEQADGRIIIGGNFETFNQKDVFRLARINPDGTVDETFHTGMGPDHCVWAVAIQDDGKVLVGGQFTAFNGQTAGRLVRLNSDGSPDQEFNSNLGTGFSGSVLKIVVQPDAKILVSGNFILFDGNPAGNLARLNSDGTLDDEFDTGSGANLSCRAMELLEDGRIMIGGAFTEFNGIAITRIARLNPDGSLDSSFDPGSGADWTIMTIKTFSDEKIMVGGIFSQFNGINYNRLVRLNDDGSIDESFSPGTGANPSNSRILFMSELSDGKIFISGYFDDINGRPRSNIAILNQNGSVYEGFDSGNGANDGIWQIIKKPDGKLMVGGGFVTYNGFTRRGLALIHSDGSLDHEFLREAGPNNWVRTLVVDSNDKLLIGGTFTRYNGDSLARIARLNADGSPDYSFTMCNELNGTVYAIAEQGDGKVLIGGSFKAPEGVKCPSKNHITRLNSDGSIDASFDPGTGANEWVVSLVVQPDKKILAGGYFTAFNDETIGYLIRLNQDGSRDTDFNPDITIHQMWYYGVNKIVLLDDGKILIGGFFNQIDGLGRSWLARLNPDGSLDAEFAAAGAPNGYVWDIAGQPDGKIIIVGDFDFFAGVPRNGIARLHPDGSLDTSFDPGTGIGTEINAYVTSVVLQDDGKIVIGGLFTQFNNQPARGLVRLNHDGSIDEVFNAGSGANERILDIVMQSDGNFIIAGGFSEYNKYSRSYIARVFGDAQEVENVMYTLMLEANPAHAGEVNGGGDYEEGHTTTINATAHEGYEFINWTDHDGVEVYIDAENQVNISDHMNLIANFTEVATSADVLAETNFSVYPNPFSQRIVFSFPAETDGNVLLNIFDVRGRVVATFSDDFVVNGNMHEIEYLPEPGTEGVLFYRLFSGEKVYTGKIIHQQ